jgi:hypothetical protein
LLTANKGASEQYFKTIQNAIITYIHTYTHTYAPYGLTLWDSTSVQGLLQYEIVKSGLRVADGCKIILVLVKLYGS